MHTLPNRRLALAVCSVAGARPTVGPPSLRLPGEAPAAPAGFATDGYSSEEATDRRLPGGYRPGRLDPARLGRPEGDESAGRPGGQRSWARRLTPVFRRRRPRGDRRAA
jgi:hypothetical protein